MIKSNGKEFKQFYNDKSIWPVTYAVMDELVEADGKEVDPDDYESIPDFAKVKITDGLVYDQECDDIRVNEICSFEVYFRRWRKQQMVEYFVVEIDKTKVQEFKIAIKHMGGKIK